MGSKSLGDLIWDVSSIYIALTCGITALGFAKHHLNRDSSFRKLANEAIFPFYLLHQPVIVVVGYFVVGFHVPVLLKVLFITLSSFAITSGLYWLVIRRFNFLRLLFGMKWIAKEIREPDVTVVLKPVMAETTLSLAEIKQQVC
jgi:peptidoglycan/LPS O-acetylase OafA/YrhL